MHECKTFIKGATYEVYKVDALPNPKIQPFIRLMAVCENIQENVATFKLIDVISESVENWGSGYIHCLNVYKYDLTEYSIISVDNKNYMIIADKEL